MRVVSIVVPPSMKTSFFYVAQNLRAWIDPSYKTVIDIFPHSGLKIYIGDLGSIVSRYSYRRVIDVWWVDSCLWYENLPIEHLRGEVWTASLYNARMIKDWRNHIATGKLKVVGRLAHPLFFKEYPETEKEYDFIVVATDVNRKNVPLAMKICSELKARCLFISPIHDIKPHTLATTDLIKLYRKARFLLFLSKAEGFGMPVLEANLLGVPAIYTQGHSVMEFACGLPVMVREARIENTPFGKCKMFYPDEEKAVEVARKALELSKDEYQEISERCREYAVSYQYSIIEFINDFIRSRLG